MLFFSVVFGCSFLISIKIIWLFGLKPQAFLLNGSLKGVWITQRSSIPTLDRTFVYLQKFSLFFRAHILFCIRFLIESHQTYEGPKKSLKSKYPKREGGHDSWRNIGITVLSNVHVWSKVHEICNALFVIVLYAFSIWKRTR